jgi:integrase
VDDPHYPTVTTNPFRRMVKLLRDPHELDGQKLEKDKFYTEPETKLLLATAERSFPEWYAFLLTGLRTGLRPGELFALQWKDIDWAGNFIRVHRGWVRGQVAGKKVYGMTSPKNRRERTVDLSLGLKRELARWRRSEQARWMAKGLCLPDLVFSSEARTPHDPSKVAKAYDAIQKKAGLSHRVLHAMRHTFISLLLQHGVPIAKVSSLAGHRSVDVTFKVYSHFMPGGSQADVNRLDGQPQRRQMDLAQRSAS